uniref:Pectinesterase inhibitor domain-containing protein n=1 Tax=Chenopodium quinoa TaxID=63459 RepID=A0A803LMT5_CHEQI
MTLSRVVVNLIEANWTADYVTAIKNKISAKDVVVRDCVELTKGAVGLIRDSLDEMKMVLKSSGARRRNERGRRNIRFEMSNVQTWMSAAITNQDTCMEGFNDVQVGKKVDDEVSEKVGYVVKLISNALSLVNSFAADA